MMSMRCAGPTARGLLLSATKKAAKPVCVTSACIHCHASGSVYQASTCLPSKNVFVCSGRFASASTQAKPIASSVFNAAEKMISVHWGSSPTASVSSYPAIYLRDNCTCSKCLHSSGIRTREMVMWNEDTVDAMTEIRSVQLLLDNSVNVKWGDGHESTFSAEWLREHRLSSDPSKGRDTRFQLPPRIHWTADTFPRDKRFRLKSLEEPETLLEFLLCLRRYGVGLLTDCDTKEGAVTFVSDKVALLRETVFGPTWQIRPMANANSIAYTKYEAPMHIDLPYLQTPPGILMLHCLSQAPTGGNTYCTDGFLLAETLRREDPETFQLLCEVPVTWATRGLDQQFGMEYNFEVDMPVIELQYNGELRAVRLNQVRSSFLQLDADKAARFYTALRKFSQLSRSPEYRMAVRLEPGEMILIDNHRMLHGRAELDPAGAAVRCLSGGYMDWDLVISRIRQLHFSLGNK